MTTYSVYPIKNERFLYQALQFNVLLTVMNTTMFNVALPVIARQLSLSSSLASWIVTCYSVMFAIGTVTYSRLTYQYSIKRLLTIGLILLGTGSVIGMLTHSLYWLLFARLIQASGASCIPGVSMVITNRYIPEHRKGAALGKVASASTLAFGLGPLLGGFITEYWGWTYLFLITLFALLMLPIYYQQLPEEENVNKPFDKMGLFLLSMGVICLLLLISTRIIWFAIGLVTFFIFWRHIHSVEKPFIDPQLLKDRFYVFSLAIGFFVFIINFSVMFLVPLLLSSLFQASAAIIGLIIFPGAIGSALASVYIGRLLDRSDSPRVIAAGIGLMFTGAFLFSSFSYLSQWLILLFYLICGIGFSCISSGIPHYLSRLLPEKQFATAIGLQQLIQFFGGAFGVTCTGVLLDVTKKDSFNGLWHGSSAMYSNAFLFLQLIAVLAGVTLWLQQRGKKEESMISG